MGTNISGVDVPVVLRPTRNDGAGDQSPSRNDMKKAAISVIVRPAYDSTEVGKVGTAALYATFEYLGPIEKGIKFWVRLCVYLFGILNLLPNNSYSPHCILKLRYFLS